MTSPTTPTLPVLPDIIRDIERDLADAKSRRDSWDGNRQMLIEKMRAEGEIDAIRRILARLRSQSEQVAA